MQDPTWEECKIAALMNVCDSDVCMCLRGNALLACVHVFMCGYIYIYIYIYIYMAIISKLALLFCLARLCRPVRSESMIFLHFYRCTYKKDE